MTGFVGQISLAPYAFAGFAAFAMVRLRRRRACGFPFSPHGRGRWSPALLGVLVGLPAVKVRGLNLAIVTLGAAVAIQELLFKWDWFVGDSAPREVPDPVARWPLDLTISAAGDAYPRIAFGLLCIGVLAGVRAGGRQPAPRAPPASRGSRCGPTSKPRRPPV